MRSPVAHYEHRPLIADSKKSGRRNRQDTCPLPDLYRDRHMKAVSERRRSVAHQIQHYRDPLFLESKSRDLREGSWFNFTDSCGQWLVATPVAGDCALRSV